MATCKDCLHVEVCREYVMGLAAARGVELDATDIEQVLVSDDCENFKDRSRFVELPCDIISKAEIKRELSAQCAVKKIDVETAKDMLENLPYIRVNTKQELKERENGA